VTITPDLKRTVLDAVLIGAACIGFCRWQSPKWLRRAAVLMMARAESIEAQQKAQNDGLKHWEKCLEVNEVFK